MAKEFITENAVRSQCIGDQTIEFGSRIILYVSGS